MAQDWRKKSIFEMIAEGHCEATHVQHYSKNAIELRSWMEVPHRMQQRGRR